MIFAQDGVLPLFTHVVIDLLNAEVTTCWIRTGSSASWPSRSLDIPPCYYFLLVYSKDRLYRAFCPN